MRPSIKFILGALALSLLPGISAAQSTVASNSAFRKAPVQVAYSQQKRKDLRINALKKDAARILRKPPKTLYNETALGCMAVAVYHEARGESVIGQKAVASVIVQRSLTPQRWGETPCEVVKPIQFSFMTSQYRFPPVVNDAAWVLAVRVALTVMYEGPMEDLKGADHYHATYVDPRWRYSMRKIGQIGNHIFYSDPESIPFTFVSR